MSLEYNGPSFGWGELITYPWGREKTLWSFIKRKGFEIPGKLGDINPLTGDVIIHNCTGRFSESTL
jgi:hypothetical protein